MDTQTPASGPGLLPRFVAGEPSDGRRHTGQQEHDAKAAVRLLDRCNPSQHGGAGPRPTDRCILTPAHAQTACLTAQCLEVRCLFPPAP